MDIYSSDYMIFMSEAYAEAYDEMIKWNNEQVLEEKSHGKLTKSFRQAFDVDRECYVKIVYDLTGHPEGYEPNGNDQQIKILSNRTHTQQANNSLNHVRQYGDTDHSSTNQRVLAIENWNTHERYKSANVIGPRFLSSLYYYFDEIPKNQQQGKSLRDRVKLCSNAVRSTFEDQVTTIKVGEIDTIWSHKTTNLPIDPEGFSTLLNRKNAKRNSERGVAINKYLAQTGISSSNNPYAHHNESVNSFMETMGWLFEADDEEDEEEEKEVSNAVYKINYYFKKNLQEKYITPILEKRRNRDLIMDFTAKFIDDHHTALSAPGPMYSFTFGKPETSFFYNLFNLTEDMILDIYANVIKETYYGKISSTINGFIVNAPHKLLITGMLVDAFQHEYDDIVECCEYLWSFCEYPILFKKFWSIGVNEEVMKYTIEHLPGKFKIINKKLTTLQALLKYDSNTAIAPYKEPMKTDGADHLYINLVRSIRNQIKATFKNIARLYYDNAEKNNTQHQSVSEFDDGTMADQEGINSNISQIVEKTCTKFASKEVNGAIVKACAEMSQVDKGNLTGYISQIFSVKNNKVSKFVENIITAYFTKNPSQTEIDSSEFINYGLAMYRSIGTSKDPLFSEIKLILNYWMNDIIQIRESYSREATIINYTRAIYNYFILMIKHYN